MSSQRWFSVANACLLLVIPVAIPATAFAEDSATASRPSRFGQLLQVGEAILLRPSSEHSMYSVRLLTRDQREELNTTFAKYTEMRKHRDEIDVQLKTEKGVSERASLFIDRQELAAAISKTSSTARLKTYAYEIVHVGDDYVTLKQPESQKYIPLRSIREMVRGKTLGTQRSSVASFGRRSSNGSAASQLTQFRLRNAPAAKVAKLVQQFYPEVATDLVVNEAANLLLVTTDANSTRQLKEFIDTLDAAVLDEDTPKGKQKP